MGPIELGFRITGIDGVVVHLLKQFVDKRGKVMHMMSTASPLFERFGEVYFSALNSGAVKAWKRHRRMVQHLAVPVGKVRIAIYDDRPESPTCGKLEVLDIGEGNYALVRIPPLLWYGFKGISDDLALIANCTDLLHDPEEQDNVDPTDKRIPYQW